MQSPATVDRLSQRVENPTDPARIRAHNFSSRAAFNHIAYHFIVLWPETKDINLACIDGHNLAQHRLLWPLHGAPR